MKRSLVEIFCLHTNAAVTASSWLHLTPFSVLFLRTLCLLCVISCLNAMCCINGDDGTHLQSFPLRSFVTTPNSNVNKQLM